MNPVVLRYAHDARYEIVNENWYRTMAASHGKMTAILCRLSTPWQGKDS